MKRYNFFDQLHQANIERALSEFLALAGQDNQRENVGAVLGMATAYMLLKQTPRARSVNFSIKDLFEMFPIIKGTN